MAILNFFEPLYIDPAVPLDRWERKVLRRKAQRLWASDWRNRVLFYGAMVLMVVFLGVMAPYLVTGPWGFVGYAIAISVGCYIFLTLAQRWRYARIFRELVRAQGFDICVKCGYWIRGDGSQASRCPECGWTST